VTVQVGSNVTRNIPELVTSRPDQADSVTLTPLTVTIYYIEGRLPAANHNRYIRACYTLFCPLYLLWLHIYGPISDLPCCSTAIFPVIVTLHIATLILDVPVMVCPACYGLSSLLWLLDGNLPVSLTVALSPIFPYICCGYRLRCR
jgi:hypothetical protein